MIEIPYSFTMCFITLLWLFVRGYYWKKQGFINWKREMQLTLVYVCIVVIARFTFFPFSKVNGKVQPLLFDPNNIYPFWINLEPVIHLFEYEIRREAIVNFVGNTCMFIPVGIIWPIVFKELDNPWKVIAAGVGYSLIIEIIQLPFFGRCSDVDDLLLNSIGYIAGYGIYLLVKTAVRFIKQIGTK